MEKFKKLLLPVIVLFLILVTYAYTNNQKEYTITFDSNGGTPITSKIVEKGEDILVPEPPVREGYKFIGWTLNNEPFDFTTELKEDIKLVAKWKKLEELEDVTTKYKVTFDSNGGSSVLSQTVEENSSANKPLNPSRDGYKFISWQLDSKDFDFTTKITKNINLIAKWEKIETELPIVKPIEDITVTFDSKGGSKVPNKIIKAGNTIPKPANPTRDDYKFIGWYRNNSEWNFNWTTNVNITLVAKWKKVTETPTVQKYTVTFDSNGGTAVANQTVEKGKLASTPQNPTLKGYNFIGWTLSGENYKFSTTKVTKDITLVAKWEKIDEYTFSTDKIGEQGLSTRVRIFKNDNEITKEAGAIYDTNNKYLGRYDEKYKGIIVDNNDVSKIKKIKINNIYFNIK